jgi:phytanoyl-CoA hydroxylase
MHALYSSFRKDGYVHLPDFLNREEIGRIEHEVERYQRDVLPGLDAFRALYDIDANGARRAIKQLADMDKADSFFSSLLHDDRTAGLARTLLRHDVIPHTFEFFDKAPALGQATPPHQDGFYHCLVPNESVTLWVALDECDEDNGCLYYIRGSHLGPLLPHSMSRVVGFSQGIQQKHWNPSDEVAMRVHPGDCIAHHAGTIHFAGANRSNRHRRSIGMVYFSASAVQDPEARQRLLAELEAQRKEYRQDALNV